MENSEPKREKPDPYQDFPCRKCNATQRASCCGCPEERAWKEKHKDILGHGKK